jgi:hypothetical protein
MTTKINVRRMLTSMSVRLSGLIALLLGPFVLRAQVPVHEEPYHRPVFQNEYIRILDVQIMPGDTSRMHRHAIPSVFIYLSDTEVASQVMGQAWVSDKAVAGRAWYRSFTPDTLVHRVTALGPKPLHVFDIELLAPPEGKPRRTKRLRYPVQTDSLAATIYTLTAKDLNRRPVKSKSPLVIVPTSGEGLTYTDRATNQYSTLCAGTFHYVPPKTVFYLTEKGKAGAAVKIFQIK